MTKKGLYKLITNPTRFLKDYVAKKQRKFEYIIPKKKVIGEHQYTVVSAVYNVAPYLEDYFKSLVHQTLDFEEHIFLILVDDGSPDNSSEIIKKWQKKYPNNITYIKKENGGQATARNFGMNHVKTEWVTFIDPDDFVDLYYFEKIDTFLVENSSVTFSMLSCNLIFFHEQGGNFKNTHPLKYKFSTGKKIVLSDNMEGKIQLSASTAFFRRSIIQDNNILFNAKIRPSFEDAHFIGIYLLHLDSSLVGFLKEAKYFYRKRAESNSTLDTGWQMPSGFDEVLRIGCLGLFEESMKIKGYVSKEMQKTVLYHLIWHFKKIVNNPSSVSFLSTEQKKTYKSLLREIFTYIDFDTIDSFSLGGAWFFHKVALMGIYKEKSHSYQIAYIDAYDEIKNEVKVRYFSYFDNSPFYIFDGKEALARYSTVRKHDFLSELFVNEHIAWVPVGETGVFNIFIDNKLTHLHYAGKHSSNGIDIEVIRNFFNKKSLNSISFPLNIRLKRKLYQGKYYAEKYKDAWLLMDREDQADDNAEHLYRYLMDTHRNINIFYIIRKGSSEWNRLEKDGFNLIDFTSTEHEASLIHAKHMISSDAVKYITNYLPNKYYKDLLSFKFTFLQHGVTKDDLSAWLNSKKIDCFVVAAQREYNSIAGNDNRYKFTSKEVSLTGFPRHDNLIAKNHIGEKTIMIMPTWREYLNEITEENYHEFKKTPYAKAWISLLHSRFLKKMHQEEGYQLLFFPHPNIKKFLNEFDIPNYIELVLEQKGSIQTLFQQADLLLTDYSSVAFEMAILNKQTIYYQFDYAEIFSGSHTYEKGYFEYEKDAFGPICYDEQNVIDRLKYFVASRGEVDAQYLERMQNFFAFHDINNSQRTFEAIENLYNPNTEKISNAELLKLAKEAKRFKTWKAIENRYEQLLKREIILKDTFLVLSEAKCLLGKVEEAKFYLDKYIEINTHTEKTSNLSKKIVYRKELLDTLDRQKQKLLINDKEDFLMTLTYKNIIQWFKENKWDILSVATKLIDKRVIVNKELGYFYYICLVTANELKKHDDALSYVTLIKKYS